MFRHSRHIQLRNIDSEKYFQVDIKRKRRDLHETAPEQQDPIDQDSDNRLPRKDSHA